MYVSLYRRYRPQLFSEVIGQTAAIGVITRAVESGNVGHAYLFSGPRGCGKTTVARLFAKAVNCPNRKGAEPCNECDTCRSIVEGSCLDVIEIDGASNNGVDEIRDLKEHVALATFTCPYKVYIIDEVHMLSAGAFNALLKTLEEPPERVIFILATTAPHKVPVTIRSRCQHIPFHGISPEQIVERLQQVSQNEKIQSENEALWEIARNSDGGMRDALSLMEQAIAFGAGKVTCDTIEKLLGGGSSSSIRQWVSCCHNEPEKALPRVEGLFRSGAVPERFLSVLFACIRNLWLQCRWGAKGLEGLSLSEEEHRWIESEKGSFELQHLERLMSQIASLLPQVRRGLSNDVLCGLLVSWFIEKDPVFSERSEYGAINSAAELSPAAHVQRAENTVIPQQHTVEKLLSVESAATQVKTENAAGVYASQHNEPHHAEQSESSDVPINLPKTAGLVPVNDEVAKKLSENLFRDPQNMMALRLADILWEKSENAVSVVFDENDAISFEALKNRRTADALRAILKDLSYDVKSVLFYCGTRSEVFKSLEDLPVFNVSQSHVNISDDLKKNNDATEVADNLGLKRTEEHNLPEIKQSEKNSFAVGAREERETLSDYLRGFMDGELLFCRPNEKSEDTDEDNEN